MNPPKNNITLNKLFGVGAVLLLPVFAYLIWQFSSSPATLTTLTDSYQGAGTLVRQDFQSLPVLPLTETDQSYTITDTTSDGIDIQFANQGEPTLSEGEDPLGRETSNSPLTLSFPKDYSQPLEVKLDEQRIITITDLGGQSGYTSDTLSQDTSDPSLGSLASKSGEDQETGFFQRLLSLRGSTSQSEGPENYLRYTSQDERKSLLYAYQKDQATGEKKLKHWTLYQKGNGIEQESYQFTNAKLRITGEGIAEVFYYGEQDLKNDQAAQEVDTNLLDRAQRFLAKEMGDDLLSGSHTPDFTIPKPYYIDNQGTKHDAEWKWNEESGTLSVSFTPESYPVALDPTLSFTAPGVSNSGSVITGEGASDRFGSSMTAGDFNADGKIDLAVGAYFIGHVYIFYNDGTITTSAATADIIITHEGAGDQFGMSLASGDFNADGKTDLAVGANLYPTNLGRVYLFYNDTSYPSTAVDADIILTGETTGYFGSNIAAGDFNADGKTDLAVGAYRYTSYTGRVYIFYNGSIITEAASGADIILTGETTSNYFGNFLAAGDWNADSRTDLAVGADRYSTNTGRTYIFYNGSIITENASGADIIITGETTSNYFGGALVSGDWNTDGKVDLAVSAAGYSSFTGRTYIFYSGSIITENASGADIIITGEAVGNVFGDTLASGDWNADGRADLAVGAYGYTTNTGRAYLFYNDGSIPTTAATADVIITGQGTSNSFGFSLTTGDFNADGKTDLAVGASGYASSQGQAYIFYSQNGQVNTNRSITGETTSNYFGIAMTTGDFNVDGLTDLIVSAPSYSTSTGRVYVFYNDGTIPTTAATADVIITGQTAGDSFGAAPVADDFNADGRTDLAVGAYGYSSSTGRAYIFYGGSIITENASGADVIITGQNIVDIFGYSLVTGDFNADGKIDLAVGAGLYATGASTGRAYIFYNDGSIPTTAATADVIITGEASSYFGYSLASGDWNADGRTDLAVGARAYSSNTGRAYLFYNDGSIPTTAVTADVTITGETTGDLFGSALTAGDMNSDGRTDLVVGAHGHSTNTGKVYYFYNDGSIPTTAVTADVTITGETTGDLFGSALTAGDMNSDGRTDLVVGAHGHSTSTGKVYFYETRENFAWEIQEQFGGVGRTGVNGTGQEIQITGETMSLFGTAMTTGDFNADGKTDLVVSASGYASNTGRVYLFYGDGSLTVGAESADVIITGETTSNYFGGSLASGDWNADGRTDLAVGASGYSGSNGRAYIFYNNSMRSMTATNADVFITGDASAFSGSLLAGDWNADGRTDLAVGATSYSSSTGRAYIFYGGSIITENASGADVIITGQNTLDFFGGVMLAGDWNTDGKTDLAVGAYFYASFGVTGRVYIFYGGSIITENASGANVIITGETTGNYFGYSLASGDWNADGRTDLAVGARTYSSNTGRAYIFYGGSIITENASGADVRITGEGMSNFFGGSLASGDWNADGRTDLAVGASGAPFGSNIGRAYIFYNDGSIPTTAATADVIISGQGLTNYFGDSLASGDWNADGRTDLAVGASGYASSKGKVYIYTFNDPIITGEASSRLGASLASGDWNADGRTDLAVGAYNYASGTGRLYIFYGGSVITENASGADVIITGEGVAYFFSFSIVAGDWNADGRTDLVVGSVLYPAGRAYIFYGGSIITENASGADVIISGQGGFFSVSLASGDWNADGRTDLAVGAYDYSSVGRAYIFYNDGSIPTTAATADVIITGQTAGDSFGAAPVADDFNADGRTDLAVGAYDYSSSTGRAYIFYGGSIITENASGADVIITGEASSGLGLPLIVGDWNADGRTDLAVGATSYSSNTGRAYIFYGGSIITENASGANVIITGETTGNYFSVSLASGDWNADGRTDLAVGAHGYSSTAGRVYIYISEVATALTPPGTFYLKGGGTLKGTGKLK